MKNNKNKGITNCLINNIYILLIKKKLNNIRINEYKNLLKKEKKLIIKFVFILFAFNIFIINQIFIEYRKKINSLDICYTPPEYSNLKIIHLIITRFMFEYNFLKNIRKIMYKKDYILNGIRVLKKYLIPSLENQSCKKFIWILLLGDKANKMFIKQLLGINNLFQTELVYERELKSYIKIKSMGYDVLITTRIDYDDRIYYDAVNDARKVIDLNKPMMLYGYNKGAHYYENDNKYYEFYMTYKNRGCMSVFVSLITILNKTNDTYNIYDLGSHTGVRKKIQDNYQQYGMKSLNYDPAIFDSGTAKFVWVRHNNSFTLKYSENIKSHLKEYKFDLNKFYGKYKK